MLLHMHDSILFNLNNYRCRCLFISYTRDDGKRKADLFVKLLDDLLQLLLNL